MEAPETLQQAMAFFSDPERAFEAAKEFRWPGGNVTCPRCGQAKHSFVKTRRIWFCYVCKKQFTVKVGTVMEDSPIGLDKWMVAIWMLANCKNGISSYELAKIIGVRQNTAWFMLHRIREAMKGNDDFKFGGEDGGPVEADETWIGGEPRNRRLSKRNPIPRTPKYIKNKFGFTVRNPEYKSEAGRGTLKTPVFGLLDRERRQARVKVVPTVNREILQAAILDGVSPKSAIYTDENRGYKGIEAKEYIHEAVNHTRQYVRGEVHTNGLENFWALLKRTLRGTYVAVEPFHLDHYLDEQVFRYNNRATKDNKLTDTDRFVALMSMVAGKRLTYAELTGKDSNEPHHPEAGTGQEEPF